MRQCFLQKGQVYFKCVLAVKSLLQRLNIFQIGKFLERLSVDANITERGSEIINV